MWASIVAWYKTHSITTHSLVAAFSTLVMLYAAVPEFHQLVVNIYAGTPPWFHQAAAAAFGIWALYQGSSSKK